MWVGMGVCVCVCVCVGGCVCGCVCVGVCDCVCVGVGVWCEWCMYSVWVWGVGGSGACGVCVCTVFVHVECLVPLASPTPMCVCTSGQHRIHLWWTTGQLAYIVNHIKLQPCMCLECTEVRGVGGVQKVVCCHGWDDYV